MAVSKALQSKAIAHAKRLDFLQKDGATIVELYASMNEASRLLKALAKACGEPR